MEAAKALGRWQPGPKAGIAQSRPESTGGLHRVSHAESADHVGCSQKYVSQMKEDVIPRYNVPPTRKDSKGRNQSTVGRVKSDIMRAHNVPPARKDSKGNLANRSFRKRRARCGAGP